MSVIILNFRADPGHESRTLIVLSPNFNHYTVTGGFKFRSLTLDINPASFLRAYNNDWANGTLRKRFSSRLVLVIDSLQ
jgi:hypothetical protein